MIVCNEKKRKAFLYQNGKYIKIKKGYIYENEYKKIYSAGNIVTYQVDSGTSYQEEVDSDASCLSPTTFVPEKSDWTFVGWRDDTTASGDVLTEMVMGDNPITLYAVFKQNIILSYNGNGATSGATASQYGTRYYNNGNVVNPSFKLASNGFSRTYYTFNGWNIGAVGATVTLSTNTTAYAKWIGTPYSITSFNISEWTFSEPNGSGEYDYGVDGNGDIWVSAERTSGHYAFGQLSKTISTHGCNKLRVKYGVSAGYNPWCTIYGKEFSFEESQYNQYAYFDVSGENINFYFIAQSAAGGNCVDCTINELYFYNG